MAKSLRENFLRACVINTRFLHELSEVKDLFKVIAKERKLLPAIIEKDYWLMHCLWGIQQQGFKFGLVKNIYGPGQESEVFQVRDIAIFVGYLQF